MLGPLWLLLYHEMIHTSSLPKKINSNDISFAIQFTVEKRPSNTNYITKQLVFNRSMQLTKEINLQNSKSIFSKHLSIHSSYITQGLGYFNQRPIETK
jgi:hypothetical protein